MVSGAFEPVEAALRWARGRILTRSDLAGVEVAAGMLRIDQKLPAILIDTPLQARTTMPVNGIELGAQVLIHVNCLAFFDSQVSPWGLARKADESLRQGDDACVLAGDTPSGIITAIRRVAVQTMSDAMPSGQLVTKVLGAYQISVVPPEAS